MAVLLPDGIVREHLLPTTLGPRVLGSPLTVGPSLGVQPRLAEGEMSGSPPMPKEPLRPSSLLQGYHQGGAPFGASAPEDWCQSVNPPKISISSPREKQVAPSQDPATLRSTISSLQQLDQGPGSNHQEAVPWWIRTDTTLEFGQ